MFYLNVCFVSMPNWGLLIKYVAFFIILKGIIRPSKLKEIDLYYYSIDTGEFFIPMVCIKPPLVNFLITGIRKFSCICEIVKEVEFLKAILKEIAFSTLIRLYLVT